MKSVAFIGNSHLAAIKQGFDQIGEALSYRPVFFGAPSDALRYMVVENGKLVSKSPRLSALLQQLWQTDEFDFSGHDAVYLVGMGAGIRMLGPLYHGYRADEHSAEPGTHRLSKATFDLAMAGLLKDTVFGAVAKTVRTATNARLYAVSQPAPAEAIQTSAGGEWFKEALRNGDASKLAAALSEAIRTTFAPMEVLEQPPETKANPLMTKMEYMVGSVRLKGGAAQEHPEDDVTHANARYGAIVLRDVDRQYRPAA